MVPVSVKLGFAINYTRARRESRQVRTICVMARTKATKPTARKLAAKASPAARDEPDRQQRFLADIIVNANDKQARLVYADLLQEAGDARGEFIALQCARSELSDADERSAELEARTDALLKKHKKAWSSVCGENKGARYEYRRGFVEKISLDAKDLLANSDKIFAMEPIEELNVWKIHESTRKLGNSKLAPILELPLHRIRRLSLARCLLNEDDFAALAEATTLGSVEVLDLTNGGSNDNPAAPLAKTTSLPTLRELILRGCLIGDEGVAALAESTTLKMQKLILARNDLTGASGEAIANAGWAPGLVYLDLSSNEMFGDTGLAGLAASTKLGALRSLILEYTGLHEDAPALFKTASLFKQLELIDITQTAVSVDDLRPVLGERVVYKRRA